RSLLPAKLNERTSRQASLLERAMSVIGSGVRRSPRGALAAVLVAVTLVSSGISLLRVDSSFRSWFDSTNNAIVADQAIRERFVGTSTMRLLIETDAPQGLYDPAALRAISQIQRLLDADPLISATLSIADFLRAANGAMGEGPHENDLPDDP